MKDVLKLIGNRSYANSRDSGSLKIVFFPSELRKKQIRFWANVGTKPKESKIEKTIKQIKDVLGIRWANNCVYLSYYAGGRICNPFSVHWMGDKFEFTLWDFLGLKQLYHFSRTVKSQNEMFTNEEIKTISGYLEGHYHLINKGFDDLREKIGNPKNYNDFSSKMRELKHHETR